MLPSVYIIRGNRFLADQPVYATFTTIADIFDLYGGNLTLNSGHVQIINESEDRLNFCLYHNHWQLYHPEVFGRIVVPSVLLYR